jgi:hypothetical protein
VYTVEPVRHIIPFTVAIMLMAPTAAGLELGLLEYTGLGTAEQDSSITINIPAGVAVSQNARIAEPPINTSTNGTWRHVQLTPAQPLTPGDIWNISVQTGGIFFRDTAELPTTSLEPGTYVLFMWGCSTGDRIPDNCRWLKPQTVSVANFSRTTDEQPEDTPDNQAGFVEGSLEIPDNANRDETFSASAEMQNQGSTSFSGEVEAELIGGEGNTVDSSSTSVIIDSGSTTQLSTDLTVPESVPYGSCYTVELTCPDCERLEGLSGRIKTGIASIDCVGQQMYADVSISSQPGANTSRTAGENTVPVSVTLRNEGQTGAVIDVEHTALMNDADNEVDDIGDTEREIYVGPTSYRTVRSQIEIDSDEHANWVETEIDCADDDLCTTSEPTVITECRDAPFYVSEGVSLWVDGEQYAYEGGSTDDDEEDWIQGGIPDGRYGSARRPDDLHLREDAPVVINAPDSIPTGSFELQIYEEDGDEQHLYNEEYNWEGTDRIVEDFTADSDELLDEHRLVMDWGCGTTEATVEVRQECDDGQVYSGGTCVDQGNVLDLAAVPLHYEQEQFASFVAETQRQVRKFATASPLTTENVVIHAMEPEDSETNPDLEDPDTDGCGELNNIAQQAVQGENRLSSVEDKIIATSQTSIQLGGNSDVKGCAALFSPTEVTESDSSSPGIMAQEIGHSFGMCHTEGVASGGTCDTDQVAQEGVDVAGHHILDKPHCPGSGPEAWTGCQETHSTFCMNHEGSGGQGDIMNYCSPWDYYAGSPQAPEDDGDSYQYLDWKFSNKGWLN